MAIREKFYGREHPLVATSLSNIGSYLFALGHLEQAQDMYKQCLAIRKKVLGEKHIGVGITLTCIDICLNALRYTACVGEEKENNGCLLDKAAFQELLNHATDYLQDNASLMLEKNPSGFVRIRLPVPKGFILEDQIENLRLHYWPPGVKVDTVEALHDHPRYFESMILNGGYTHAVYRRTEEGVMAESFRLHRILKAYSAPQERNPEERNIFCLGTVKLENLGNQMVSENSMICFPKSLIHQVLEYQPATLTINAVFKSPQDLSYFDVYMPEDSHVDPQREREYLTSNESASIVFKIKDILSRRRSADRGK